MNWTDVFLLGLQKIFSGNNCSEAPRIFIKAGKERGLLVEDIMGLRKKSIHYKV